MVTRRSLDIPSHRVIDVVPTQDERERRDANRSEERGTQDSPPSQVYDEQTQPDAPPSQPVFVEQMDPYARLQYESRRAGQDLMSAMSRAGLTMPGTARKDPREKMTTLQQAYATQMVFHAMTPLRAGVSANSVLQAVGMSTMMLAVSPKFRQHLGSKASEVHNSITNKMARRGEATLRSKEQLILRQGGSRSDLKRRDLRRLERYERLDRHGLAPMTAESAALMEVGIAEDAYAQMRVPGADKNLVMAQHSNVLSQLYSMAERDGVDAAAISTNMRNIVAVRMRAEPHLAQVFTELSHGQFTQSAQGRIEDPSTGKYVDAGSFTPRPPMEATAHSKALGKMFTRDLDTSLSAGQEPMEAQMYVFAAGMFTQQYPDVVEAVEDPELRSRLATCRSIFSAMEADGMAPEQIRDTYQQALLDSINVTSAKSPEFADRWGGPEGDEWRARLAQQLEDFSEFAKSTQSGYGPEPKEDQTPAEPTPEEEAEAPSTPKEPTSSFPDAGYFTPPRYTNYDEPEADLLAQMSTFMGDDLVATSQLDGGRDLAGNTWMPRSVYSTPPALGESDGNFIHDADPQARQRQLQMVSMRDEMVRLGMPTAQQDRLFAASYVQGLEKAVAANPAYELVVAQASMSGDSSWQEMEFARAIARTNTSQPDEGYYGFLSRITGDTELQYKVGDVDSVKGHRSRSGRETASQTTPFAYGQELVKARELDQRRRQILRVRGRLNRAYNAEDDRKPTPLDDRDVQFDFTERD